MSLHALPAATYVTEPWKNGKGLTDEIHLGPDGSTRDEFDLRISRATIDAAAVFSPFPGAERTITVIEGRSLTLDFGHRVERLALRQSLAFDSGLTPIGRPEGVVRVVNVIAARRVWRMGPARLLRTDTDVAPGQSGLIVMFVMRGTAQLADDDHTLGLADGDSALSDGAARLSPASGAIVLVIPLQPAANVVAAT